MDFPRKRTLNIGFTGGENRRKKGQRIGWQPGVDDQNLGVYRRQGIVSPVEISGRGTYSHIKRSIYRMDIL